MCSCIQKLCDTIGQLKHKSTDVLQKGNNKKGEKILNLPRKYSYAEDSRLSKSQRWRHKRGRFWIILLPKECNPPRTDARSASWYKMHLHSPSFITIFHFTNVYVYLSLQHELNLNDTTSLPAQIRCSEERIKENGVYLLGMLRTFVIVLY